MKKIFAALLLLVLWSGLVSAQGTIECNPPAKGAGTQPGVCTGQFPLITTAAATIYQIDVTSAPVTNHVITWTNSGAPSGFSITVYAGTSGVATSLNTSTTIAGSYSFTGTYNWVGVAVTTLSSGGTQANYYGASPWIGLAASGGGWTRTGTDVALTTGTDTVHIQNTLTIANGLTVASTLTLGTSQAINYTTSLLFTSASTTNLTLSGGASPAAQFAGTLGVTGASTLSSTFTTPAAKFDSSLNTVFNVSGSLLAQNATAGFTYIPGVATGVPSGTPAISYTGAFPMAWDHTDKALYVYDGSWNAITGGGGGVTSLAGTTNQITASASTGAVTLSFPSAVTITGLTVTNKLTSLNGDTLAGNTIPAIVAYGRQTGQTAADASVVTYTAGASDESLEVSFDLLATTSTSYSFFCVLTWTDEGNTSRTLDLSSINASASNFETTIQNSSGPQFNGIPIHIRAKSGTTVTIATAGTFTTVTYNVEGAIRRLA
jgi:hypothetical protein